jgi:hypothetical protein
MSFSVARVSALLYTRSTVASLDCIISCYQPLCLIQDSLSKCPNISSIQVRPTRTNSVSRVSYCHEPAPLLYIRPINIYILLLIYIQDQPSRSVFALLHFLFPNQDNYISLYKIYIISTVASLDCVISY